MRTKRRQITGRHRPEKPPRNRNERRQLSEAAQTA
jgi:hypothetical protein